MLKLTDAATGNPCYVLDKVTGVQPILVQRGADPAVRVHSTRVWFGCACVDVRETVDEVIEAWVRFETEDREINRICDELLYGTPGDNAKQAKYGAPYPFEKRAVSVDLGSEKRTLIDERRAVVWLLDRAGIDEGLTFVGRVEELAKTRKQALDALTEFWLLVGGAGEPVKLKKLVDVVSARLREPAADDDAHFLNANYKTLGGYEKMRAALDTIWNAINPRAGGTNGERWTDPMEVNAAVRTAHAQWCASKGVNTVRAGLMNDALDAIWFRIPVRTGRHDRAWNRDDPMEVLRAMIEMLVARDKETWSHGANHAIHVSDKRRAALHAIWTMIRGEGADWTDPDEVVRAVRARWVELDDTCRACHDHTCLHDNGCAHGRQANDVPAATEREPVSTQPAALTFDDAIRLSKGCFDYGGGYRCDVDKLSIYHHGISTVTTVLDAAKKARADGVVDRQVEMVSAVGASVEDGEMAAALDAMMDAVPTHDEAAAMMLNTQNTRCCQPEAALDELTRVATQSSGRSVLEPAERFFEEQPDGKITPAGPDPDDGEEPHNDSDGDDDTAIERAFDVAHGLGYNHSRAIVAMLAGCDPQTTLRIIGHVFELEPTMGDQIALTRLLESLRDDDGLIQCVDRLLHDADKPLMDRWTLTPLGREVARVLASKE